MPTALAVVFFTFLLLPFWSLTFLGVPWEQQSETSLLFRSFTGLTYWFGPWVVCIMLWRRSYLLLPAFVLECLGLIAHASYDVTYQYEVMHVMRFAMLGCMAFLGVLLTSKDVLIPLLTMQARGFRRAPRLECDVDVLIDLGERALLSAKTVNISATGLALRLKTPDSGWTENVSSILIKLPIAFGLVEVKGHIAWQAKADGEVVLGIHVGPNADMQRLMETVSQAEAQGRWRRRLEIYWVKTSVRRSLVAMWSISVAFAFGVPACGDMQLEERQVVRVAPPGDRSEVASLELDFGDLTSFGLTGASALEVSARIEGCISGFARGSDDDKAGFGLAVPVGDAGCKLYIDGFFLASVSYSLAQQGSFDPEEGAVNHFVGSDGSSISLVTVETIADPIVKDMEIRFAMVGAGEGGAARVSIPIPLEACSLRIVEKGVVKKQPTKVEILIHPAYLPGVKSLSFSPCEGKKNCNDQNVSEIGYRSYVSHQYQEGGPHDLTATIAHQTKGTKTCVLRDVEIPKKPESDASCSIEVLDRGMPFEKGIKFELEKGNDSKINSFKVFPCGIEHANTYRTYYRSFMEAASEFVEFRESAQQCFEKFGENDRRCRSLVRRVDAKRNTLERSHLSAASYAACIPYDLGDWQNQSATLELTFRDAGGRSIRIKPEIVGQEANGLAFACRDDRQVVQTSDTVPNLSLSTPYHHPFAPADVNGDSQISLSDGLLLEADLKEKRSGVLPPVTSGSLPPPFYDVNADDVFDESDLSAFQELFNF